MDYNKKPFFIKKYIDTFKENWYNVFVSVRNLQNKQAQLIDDFSNKVLSDKGVNTNWRIYFRTLNPLCCLMPFFYDYPKEDDNERIKSKRIPWQTDRVQND